MGSGKSAAQLRAGATPSTAVAGAPKENGAPAEACVRASRRSSGDAFVWWLLASLAAAGAAFGWAMLMPGDARDAAPSVSAGYAVDHFRLARAALQRFRFVPGVTPLSSPAAPFAAVACYGAALLAARRHVAARSRPYDLELRPLVFLHNALLCCASSALLAALCAALLPDFLAAGGGAAGAMRVWCDPRPHALAAHRATAVYYMNYLVKYYELLDTLLLALRGRPTPLLHVFHHAATLILCWSQLVDDTAAQVVPIALNLAVHVAMYFYYALATLGRDVWWKRHLTRAQIIQFAADVPACGLALLLRVNAERGWGWLGGATHCRGTHRAAYAGIGLLAAYLALFIKLYIDTYVKRSRVSRAKKTS